jgi:hypothetical protein
MSAPARSRPPASALLGVLLVAVGVLANRWSLEGVLPTTSALGSTVRGALLLAADFGLVLAGLWILQKRPALRGLRALYLLGALPLLAAAAFSGHRLARGLHLVDPDRRVRSALSDMLASEKLILDLTPDLKRTLSRSAMNLRLPDEQSRALFEDPVTVVDLADAPPRPGDALAAAGITLRELPIASAPRRVPLAELRLFRPLFDQIAYFDWAKLYLVKGAFTDDDRTEFQAEVALDGLARLATGALRSVRLRLDVRFGGHSVAKDKTAWRIRALVTRSASIQEAPRPLFTEVTAGALAGDPTSLARARGSAHEEAVLTCLGDWKNPRCADFTVPAIDTHPGVTVVDVDRDGLDDLYVMDETGKNLLLRNQGDGTFRDVGPALGLDVADHATSAIFADFDNDGDADVFIGRAFGRSLYLVNEGGRYVDRGAALVDVPLPYLVSSVSAADYDGDGLLDLHLSTYASALVERRRLDLGARSPGLLADFVERPEEAAAAHPEGLLAELLPPDDARALYRRVITEKGQGVQNLFGPPNVLLHNVGGGRFVRVTEGPVASLYRNTFQATWGDYDGDGDPDLYTANDFGTSNLFRNDGGGRFTDVTKETGAGAVGFGMGASFGDYDNDGRDDLYLSDMFSKAGTRITAQIPGLDPVFARMASGNTLLRNLGGRFERVSGPSPPALQVQRADWSYSSQFVDLDGDGWLDLHAPCGYYTAPPAVAIEVDI